MVTTELDVLTWWYEQVILNMKDYRAHARAYDRNERGRDDAVGVRSTTK